MAGVGVKGAAKAGLLAGAAGTGLAVASVGVAWHRLARRALPQVEGRIEVPGLRGPVTVRRESGLRWSV